MKGVFKLAVSIGLLTLLVVMVDWGTAWREASGIPPSLALAAILLFGIQFVICAWKWRVSLLANGVDVPFGFLLRVYCIGNFFSNFLPSNVGGDIYRSYRSSKYTSLPVATFAVILERVCGLAALVLVAVIGLLWIAAEAGTISPSLFALATTTLTAGYFVAPLLAVVALGRFSSWKDRLPARLQVISGPVSTLLANKLRLIELAATSLLFQVIATGIVALLFAGIGVFWAIAESAVANGAGSVAAILPVSINGLGVTEASFAGVASQLGVGLTEAAVVSFLIRILVLPLVVVFGLMYLVEGGKAPSEVAAAIEAETV